MSGSAGTDILREFLVRVNYQVNETSRRSFINGIADVTARLFKLGGIAELSMAGVYAATVKMSEGMERLYFASQRTGATVQNLQALSLAARQVGLSAEQAQSAIEGLAAFQRNSPGGASLIRSLGVNPNQDQTQVFTDLIARFKQMPFYRARAYAGMMGIDDRTLLQAEQGIGRFGAVYKQMTTAAGLDSQKAAAGAHEFMVQSRNLGAAFDILGQKETEALAGRLAPVVNQFRLNIVANFGRIVAVIDVVARAIVQVGLVFAHLAYRGGQLFTDLERWFDSLDRNTKRVIEGLAAITVAWKALSFAFSMSPLGRTILLVEGLGAAILLLYDDWKTFKEGGKSLLDWPAIERVLNVARVGITAYFHWLIGFYVSVWHDLQAAWSRIVGIYQAAVTAIEGVFARIANAYKLNTGYFRSLIELYMAFPKLIIDHWGAIEGFVTGLFFRIGKVVGEYFTDLVHDLGQAIHDLISALTPLFDGIKRFFDWFGASWIGQRFKHMIDGMADRLDTAMGYSDPGKTEPIAPGEGKANLQETIKFWLGQGMDMQHAQAIAANEEAESGGNPTATNDAGGIKHRGIYQWSESRRDAIMAGTGIDVWHASHADQLKGAAWELNHTERGARDRFMAQNTPDTDTVGWAKFFERTDGGDAEYQKRIAMYHGLDNVGPYLGPASVAAGTAAVAGGGGATINQTNNTTIHGASDPKETAKQVGARQQVNNNQLLRNVKGSAT